jgi:hypothetical protein
MKILTMLGVAVLSLGWLVAPAAAQQQMGTKHKGPIEENKVDPYAAKRAVAADRAYSDALKRIPDAKEKYDPWGGVVPAETAKKTK